MTASRFKTYNVDRTYSVFHRVARFRSEIVILQLVTSFCQPYLLYCSECLGLTATQIRSINHTWQCALSHIFNITGPDVALVCDYTGNIYETMMRRTDSFYSRLRGGDNDAIRFVLSVSTN